MILTTQNVDFNSEMFNPSITLSESKKLNNYSFPDPNSYFVLSDAGKEYTVIENTTILLNLNRGYYEQVFSVGDKPSVLFEFSKELFGNTKPIEGIAKTALEMAIMNVGKKVPTLKNRL